jgi:hypothetical protein
MRLFSSTGIIRIRFNGRPQITGRGPLSLVSSKLPVDLKILSD